MPGTLYLCATPIGNLEDITLRVLRTLKEVDLIAAEDTRTSGHLLSHFNIETPLISYHKFNEKERGPELVDRLLAGESIALVTDAGTPAISDPGESLVRLCLEAGVPVTSLPGACAAIVGLTLSGFSARSFAYEGFLPQDKKEQQTVLERLSKETRTVIFYEAPHRLLRTLRILAETVGGRRKICLCRELTKRFEEALHMTIDGAIGYFSEKEPRGEFVLILEGLSDEELLREKADSFRDLSIADHVAAYEAKGLPRKEAMKAVAKDRGLSRRDVYQALLGGDSTD